MKTIYEQANEEHKCFECDADATAAVYTPGAPGLRYFCDEHRIYHPRPEPDYQALAAELAAALEGSICHGCNNRIGWDGEPWEIPNRIHYSACTSCRSARAALAAYRATQEAPAS